MMTTQLLHRAKRFDIEAPVVFWWSSAEGSVKQGKGMTGNISSSGVLVVTDDCPAPGVPIQMTIYMPGAVDHDHEMKLNGEGVVTRTEEQDGARSGDRSWRFAASVQFCLEPVEMSVRPR